MQGSSVRFTCQVIKTREEEYCCKVEWHASHFNITLTDGQRAWSAHSITCPDAWKKDEDEWLRRAKEALTALEKRGIYTYSCSERPERPELLQLNWQWQHPIFGLRKGQCELRSCDISAPSAISDMLFTVVNSYGILLASFTALEAQRSKLQAELDESFDERKSLAQEKYSREQQLFEKFACKCGPICLVQHATGSAWSSMPQEAHNRLGIVLWHTIHIVHTAAAAWPCTCCHCQSHYYNLPPLPAPVRSASHWHPWPLHHRDNVQAQHMPHHATACNIMPPCSLSLISLLLAAAAAAATWRAPAVVLNEKKAYLRKLQERVQAQEEQLRQLQARINDDADKWVMLTSG
jgi:hypothetical protein